MSLAAKDELRARLKQERAASDSRALAEQDVHIAEAVRSLPQFQEANMILTYLSFGKEVDTRSLIEEAWKQGKHVALPKCQPQGQMSWHLVDSFDELVPASFGMDEPDEARHRAIDMENIGSDAVALVPGLAFDQEGYRLGYGGGFYDRFLTDFPGTSIGLCRASNLYESLQDLDVVEVHDRPVDIVLTDESQVG